MYDYSVICLQFDLSAVRTGSDATVRSLGIGEEKSRLHPPSTKQF